MSALLGLIFTGISLFIFQLFPISAIILVGIGNALFHVGGGSISLNLIPRRATAPGIFVAHGAIGLFVGTIIGASGSFTPWIFAFALAVLCVLIFIIEHPKIDHSKNINKKIELNTFELVLFLILISIAVRAFVGFTIVFPWKENMNLAIALVSAVFLGKSFGGVLADRFGFMRTAILSLLFSIPLLVFAPDIPHLAIIGMFLFNITMPITLVVISNILPGKSAFAFGLASLALLVGGLPTFFKISDFYSSEWFILSLILISILSIFYALKFYFRNYEN